MKYTILLLLLLLDATHTNDFVLSDSKELIIGYNYPCEVHSLETQDGYILTLYRIPRKGPPIILVHGIGDSSDSWLVLGPQHSLAFLLADSGFDVWLFNARGNKYSKKHVKRLSKTEYWRFTFEEMGTKDLPSSIDYILNTTKENVLTYVGYSQGSTIFLVMCSKRPEYNSKIKHSILLAPVAWIHNAKFPFMDSIVNGLKPWTYLIDQLSLYEIFSSNPLRNSYHADVCRQSSPRKMLCGLEYYLSYGLRNLSHISPDKLSVVASHIPAGVSSFTLLHFVQNYVTKRFQAFDYEITSYWRSNKQYLRQLPEYNVSSVSVPITIFASATDWFSDVEDVNRLRRSLGTVANYIFISEVVEFTHIEFVYGTRARVLVNDPLIKILQSLFDIKR